MRSDDYERATASACQPEWVHVYREWNAALSPPPLAFSPHWSPTLARNFLATLMPDFQRSVSVAVAVSVKTVSVLAVYSLLLGCVRGRPRRQGAEFPAQKSERSSRRVGTADT